jgi:hypothetical protein
MCKRCGCTHKFYIYQIFKCTLDMLLSLFDNFMLDNLFYRMDDPNRPPNHILLFTILNPQYPITVVSIL